MIEGSKGIKRPITSTEEDLSSKKAKFSGRSINPYALLLENYITTRADLTKWNTSEPSRLIEMAVEKLADNPDLLSGIATPA